MSKYATVVVNKNALLSVQESISIGSQVLQRKLIAYQTKAAEFEKRNKMDTATFSKLFEKGELGDKKEWIKWDHYASVISLLKNKLSDLKGIRYES